MQASDQPSKLYYETSSFQRFVGILSVIAALVASCLTIYWANSDFLGGLNWGKDVFNYHPVLMICGMSFGFTSAALSFRLIPAPKLYVKMIHASLHAATVICIITGLAAVVTSHNYTNRNAAEIYRPNLYSNHSFVGLSALVMYFSNFIVGVMYFLVPMFVPIFSERIKAFARMNHMFIGVMALLVAMAAIESGMSELTAKKDCTYVVSSADWNPAGRYHQLSLGCQTANGIAILVLLAAFLAAYVLIGPGAGTAGSIGKSPRAEETQVISSSSAPPPLASAGTGTSGGVELGGVDHT
mmetsp:Transcript_21967/g.36793  ORF Transcript_21967/g.36793 Transcript_21967/m.36793 type:complete len:298 (-) Transcript_21967:412-1305(-)